MIDIKIGKDGKTILERKIKRLLSIKDFQAKTFRFQRSGDMIEICHWYGYKKGFGYEGTVELTFWNGKIYTFRCSNYKAKFKPHYFDLESFIDLLLAKFE